MKTQKITWTALPNGTFQYVDGTSLRLSVYVSPRLESDDKNDTLASFPDFLDWPATLFPDDDRREVIFHVQFGSGNPIQATIVSDLPSSELWRSLFDDNTRIEPYEMKDFKAMPIQSFPVKNIQSFFKQQYVDLATASGEDFPSADALVKNSGAPFRPLALSYRENNEEQLTSEIMNELKRYGFISAGSISDPDEITKSFLQVKLFHKPFTAKRIEIQPPAIDFHKAVSLLADYPYLMKRLGLVYDLEIPVPLRTASENTVQVIATWMPRLSDVATVNVPNWDKKMPTRCYVSANSFYALPRVGNPELVDGMLPFEDKRRYEVTTLDIDGSAVKTLNFAGNLYMARVLRKTADTPENSSVPALRAAGISVARIDKAEQTHATFVKQDELNENLAGGDDIILDAEDITRGFAVDVWDSLTKGWHSLCRRNGTYEFLKSAPAIVEKHEDEGWISQGVTSAADDSSDNLRQSESLFHWYGWSLSVPQPGKTIDPDGNPAYTGSEIDPDFELGVTFKTVPGSLPRLRYGVTYRMRARAVDLAGNRLDINDKSLADDKHASEPLVYGRFEPVPPPVTVMRKPITEGESVDHIVIRSNYNTPFEAISERHIVPPKTSQTMAEEHHLFDDPGSGLVDKNAYSVIVPRESGIITGKPDIENHDLPYVDEDELELPYLPDLFSRKAVFNGFPGVAGAYPVSFGYSEGARWPDALPFRLIMAEGDTPKVSFHDGARVLEVLLPKAEVARVKLASGMFKDDVMQMGLIQWILEAGKDENPSLVLAVEGRHWMLTPYRILTLVHAVRQPLLTPEFDQFFVSRSIGQTFANLQDRVMRVSRKSTVKLDIIADWTENIDPLGETGPRMLTINARPFDFPVDQTLKEGEAQDRLYVHGRHEFGDTKYRRVTYSAIATTRFAEYFRKRIKDARLTADSPFALSSERLVEGSETVRLADNTASYKLYDARNKSGDYVMDYNGGTIRRTKASEAPSAIPQDTNLEVTFIEQPITREMENPRTLDVLSTARPAAPKLLYIVPTFSWQAGLSGKGDGTIESKRTGGGLRIYLERPWYTSGDGELLGVVLWPGPSSISISKNPEHEKIKPFVTQWGLDPVFLSGPIVALPTLDAFKLSKQEHKASGLVLEEVPDDNLKVNIAGHEVAYDSERKLWYCDMQIDAGSTYYPFIRLALVRYQPHSLARAVTGPDTVIDPGGNNVHLSRVVLADFIQLAPDRFASVARSAAASNARHITVSGLSYSKVGGYEGRAVIEASLEKIREGFDPEVAGELAWEPLNWNPVALAYQNVKELDGTSTWSGDITLPDTKNTYRLVIKEFEIFNIPGLLPIIQRRLVYADTIVLRP
ncbi:MAG: hypothetical protein PHF74_00195 [Dehalococcoidales bacterium]|nr:hypothetical protein [Dehalococcoidales bacterium]